ncbi:MAG TPA: FAD-dependent oxidoreductase [Burkholderiales bacterium]|nr:FAD-dependent oxidoreductase [Burkholderiales bacterium]
MKRVLLAGAGHAHAVVLASLARNPLYGADVTLVSPRKRQIYSGMLPGVIAGHYGEEEASIDVAGLAARAQAEFVAASIVAVDAAARSVTLQGGRRVAYDYLSLNVGSQVDLSAPGAGEHALPVKPFERLVSSLGGRRHVAIAGGGAAGVELAMALRHRGAEVTVYSEHDAFAGSAGERVRKALRRRRVDYRRGMRADALEPGPVVVSGSARQAFDLVLWASGAAALPLFAASGLALDERGFVRVDETLCSVSHPQVLAVGDCAATGEAKSGVHAVRQGALLADNLRCLVRGVRPQPYRPRDKALLILTCGARYAIAMRGDWSAAGRWVWWWKNWIDRRWLRNLANPGGGS